MSILKTIDNILCGAVDFIDATIDAVDDCLYTNIVKPVDDVFYDTIGWTNSELVHGKVKWQHFWEENLPGYEGSISKEIGYDARRKNEEDCGGDCVACSNCKPKGKRGGNKDGHGKDHIYDKYEKYEKPNPDDSNAGKTTESDGYIVW